MGTAFANEGNGVTAAAAKLAVDGDVSALRKDIDALREDVSALLKHSGKLADVKARQNIEAGVEAGKDAADKAAKSIRSASNAVEDRIRENPLAAVGVALGAGVALSMLYRK